MSDSDITTPAVDPAPADIPGAETLAPVDVPTTVDPVAVDPVTPAAVDPVTPSDPPAVSDPGSTFGGVPSVPNTTPSAGEQTDDEPAAGPTVAELEQQLADTQAQLAAANAAAAASAPPVVDVTSPAASSSDNSSSPVPPAPASSPEADPAPAAASSSSSLKPGDVVGHSYFDPYRGAGGEEVTVRGLVVAIHDDRAQVAWLLDVSDPLPVDELELAE